MVFRFWWMGVSGVSRSEVRAGDFVRVSRDVKVAAGIVADVIVVQAGVEGVVHKVDRVPLLGPVSVLVATSARTLVRVPASAVVVVPAPEEVRLR